MYTTRHVTAYPHRSYHEGESLAPDWSAQAQAATDHATRIWATVQCAERRPLFIVVTSDGASCAHQVVWSDGVATATADRSKWDQVTALDSTAARLATYIGAAAEHYSIHDQLGSLMEECAEVIVAASHVRRDREGACDDLAREIADVELMIASIKHRLGLPDRLAASLNRAESLLFAGLDDQYARERLMPGCKVTPIQRIDDDAVE